MGTAKQLTTYFPHDSNARNDGRIIRLRIRHGAAGYGVYFMLLERLREESDFTSSRDYEMISFDLHVDIDMVRSVVEDFGLFAITDDEQGFYSASLANRMSFVGKKAVDRAETYRANANKRWADKIAGNAIASTMECNCIDNGMQLHLEGNAIASSDECNCMGDDMQLHQGENAIASDADPQNKINKRKERKSSSPLPPPGGRGGDFASLEPPQDGIARNFDGLTEELGRLGCTAAEVGKIYELSNYGQIGHPVWRYIRQCVDSLNKATKDPSRIRVPGRYIIRKLQEEQAIPPQQPP